MKNIKRCEWPSNDELMIKYHDIEWGVPLHDDNKLFEFMILDSAQAGLSWRTVLHKREGYRKAFSNFDPKKVSKYTNKDFNRLVKDSSIIRNRLKIKSAIESAQIFLNIQKEFGSFDKYIWQFTNGKTINNKCKSLEDIQSVSKESDLMSIDLKNKGFKFVGSTICYAFMQATGMVNDHTTQCFRYKELNKFPHL